MVFAEYAKYYDLLYKDKDYEGEVAYIHSIIKKYHPDASSILDFGCGTGRHAELLARAGYRIHGVDLSQEMLLKANERLENGLSLSFSQGNIQDVKVNERFDVVISLFHVMSYQTTNDALLCAINNAKNHLNKRGVFIFDCWYGPAVLTSHPEVRIKRFNDAETEIIRIAEPVMHYNENLVDVNYQVFIKNRTTNNLSILREKHVMRYLFKPEIDMLFRTVGFNFGGCFEFMTNKTPGFETWGTCFVGIS